MAIVLTTVNHRPQLTVEAIKVPQKPGYDPLPQRSLWLKYAVSMTSLISNNIKYLYSVWMKFLKLNVKEGFNYDFTNDRFGVTEEMCSTISYNKTSQRQNDLLSA